MDSPFCIDVGSSRASYVFENSERHGKSRQNSGLRRDMGAL
jgi:hypothetical protein